MYIMCVSHPAPGGMGRMDEGFQVAWVQGLRLRLGPRIECFALSGRPPSRLPSSPSGFRVKGLAPGGMGGDPDTLRFEG